MSRILITGSARGIGLALVRHFLDASDEVIAVCRDPGSELAALACERIEGVELTEESAIERSSNAELVPGAILRTCSAEDLIVHKAFAARPQDWVDVEGVILKQRGRLVWPQIWADITELAELKGAPELVDELERIAIRTEPVIGPFPRNR